MMELFNLMVFLASLYGLMALVQERLSIPAPWAPFVTMVLLGSVLYVAALFGFLLWISWLVFIAGLVSAALFLRRHAQNVSYKSLVNRRTWYPAATFGALFLAGRLVTDGAQITAWDEFSFWGIFPKILMHTNEMIEDFNTINKADYPRGTALLHYYFVLFLNGGGAFRDDLAIFAQVTLFSSAVPAFLFSRDRDFRRPVVTCFMLSLVVLVYYAIFGLFVNPAYSLLVDSAVALCWTMSIMLYMTNKDTRNPMLAAGVTLFFMVQIKEIALFFALTAIFVIAVEHTLNSGPNLRRKARNIGFLIAVVTVSSVSWSLFLSFNGVVARAFTVDMGSLSDLEAYQVATIENYWHSLIHAGDLPETQLLDNEEAGRMIAGFARPIFGVSLSPFYWTILFVAFMLLFSLDRRLVAMCFGSKRMFYSFLSCLLLVAFGYVCLVLFLYLAAFSPYEAVRLASFGRYIGTQYLGLFLIALFLIAMMKDQLLLVFFVFVMLSFSDPGTSLKEIAMVDKKSVYTYFADLYARIDPVIQKMMEEWPSERGRVLLINQGGRGSFLVKFKYRAFPLSFPYGGFSLLPERKEGWPPETQEVSPDELGAIIRDRKIDYLVVWNDGEFWESYGDVVRRSGLKGIWHLQDGELVDVR